MSFDPRPFDFRLYGLYGLSTFSGPSDLETCLTKLLERLPEFQRTGDIVESLGGAPRTDDGN